LILGLIHLALGVLKLPTGLLLAVLALAVRLAVLRLTVLRLAIRLTVLRLPVRLAVLWLAILGLAILRLPILWLAVLWLTAVRRLLRLLGCAGQRIGRLLTGLPRLGIAALGLLEGLLAFASRLSGALGRLSSLAVLHGSRRLIQRLPEFAGLAGHVLLLLIGCGPLSAEDRITGRGCADLGLQVALPLSQLAGLSRLSLRRRTGRLTGLGFAICLGHLPAGLI
jgi:hypothetical protein